MKFSKYISKAVTPVMALFQKQHSCLSNKATTICGYSVCSLRQVPVRHNRGGKSTENKVRLAPPTMCRLTRITDTTVEIFYNHNRIASHRRLYGRSGQYSTVTEHMPQEHQKYLEWNGDRFRKWADSIGINTSKVVDAILTSGRIEQQSYRSCMGLLKLAEKYSPEKLEQVCAKALSYSGKPSYKSIKNLLAATKDAPDTESESSQAVKPHGITRGARYYGGKKS